jgi:apolipoprotein D and lipocalin family protein
MRRACSALRRLGAGPGTLLLLLAAGCSSTRGLPALQTAPQVDLTQYVGTWFQIAALPTSFESGCVGTQVTYAFGNDGEMSVFDECRERALDGPVRSRKGRAWTADPANQAKLDVQFYWPLPLYQRRWILELGDGYAFAAVGDPSRDSLWIYARSPRLAAATYTGIVARMRAQGYDTSRLVTTPQP